MIKYFISIIIILLILLTINKREYFYNDNNTIIKSFSLKEFDTNLINNSSNYKSYFGLKKSDTTNIPVYLLYNKYIDLLNTIIESKLDDKLQTLNTNYYKLNLEMSKYIYCRDITLINNSIDTNFINYNNNYLDLIMIQPDNIFRLDNIINTKKAKLLCKINEVLLDETLDEDIIKEYSQSVSIGFTEGDKNTIINYMNKTFNYGVSIESEIDLVKALIVITYNYLTKHVHHISQLIKVIENKKDTFYKYINEIENYDPKKSQSLAQYNSNFKKNNSNNNNIPNITKMSSKQLKATLKAKLNPTNFNKINSGSKPPYMVDKKTMKIKNYSSSSFNHLLQELSRLNTDINSLQTKYNSLNTNYNTISSLDKTKYNCSKVAKPNYKTFTN
jgi:hypothetical protein